MLGGGEYVIVSLDNLQGIDTNWTLCFICQCNNEEPLVNPFGKKVSFLKYFREKFVRNIIVTGYSVAKTFQYSHCIQI